MCNGNTTLLVPADYKQLEPLALGFDNELQFNYSSNGEIERSMAVYPAVQLPEFPALSGRSVFAGNKLNFTGDYWCVAITYVFCTILHYLEG